MYGLFVQIGILVAMTHALRALGHVAGPRRCGLILGLPSSTALMLLYCGHEYGVGEAMAAAESSLLGLVAAATLPLAYALILMVRIARALGGANWAGLFTTFPAMSLAVLVATHLESGPQAACRLAKAMPPGNLITFMFLAAFRLAGHRIGLGWGTVCGYAFALGTFLAFEGLVRSLATDWHPGPRTTPSQATTLTKGTFSPALAQTIFARRSGSPKPIDRRGRRCGRRFAPRIEVIPE
jgi:hypothetical protein